jgi:hypothetical protein
MSAASTLAIKASGLEKSFGTSRAVCGVDLAVRRGSVLDGTVPGLELTVSLGTAALLTAVFAPLATYLYGRK